MNPWRYFKIAAEVANLKNDRRHHRLGAVGLRSDGTLVAAANGPATDHTPAAHAEARLCRKMDRNGVVFVVRAKTDGYELSKPCRDCERLLKARHVRRVYYTIDSDEYGVLEFR